MRRALPGRSEATLGDMKHRIQLLAALAVPLAVGCASTEEEAIQGLDTQTEAAAGELDAAVADLTPEVRYYLVADT